MHAHTDMTLVISGNLDVDLAVQILSVVANEATDVDLSFDDNVLSFEESYRLVWYEDLVAVAISLAKLCEGKVNFEMSGTIDTSESAGEYMDYNIEFKENILWTQCSCWYLRYWGTEDWENYEEFCEEFDESDDISNGRHTYTKEFFEELGKHEEWFTTNGLGCDFEFWLDGVHMDPLQQVCYK